MDQIRKDKVLVNRVSLCVVVYLNTSPPFSLLKEAQRSEKVQTVEVVVDSQLQEVILWGKKQVLEKI